MATATRTADSVDTIYALSSGRPPAAIAVVRISGPRALLTLTDLTRAPAPVPRMATLAIIRDDRGDEIDRGLTLWFPGPASVTGEDLAELHVHGGVATVAATLRALDAAGLRHATRGEFTRRAVLHGKIEAGEVEALGDLLAAETDYQRREAIGRSRRRQGAAIRDWSAHLTDVAATIEAAIELDDDDDVDRLGRQVVTECHLIRHEIAAALAQPDRVRVRDGARIVLAGPPNAGKSTLFNTLAGEDRSIVTNVPGTTRDILEHSFELAGYPVTLVDTAGLRETQDEVEAIGVARGHAAIGSADIVIDLGETAPDHPRRVAIASKADEAPSDCPDRLAVSSVTGRGVNELLEALAGHLGSIFPVADRTVAIGDRAALKRVSEELSILNADTPLVITASAVAAARAAFAGAGAEPGLEPVLDAVYQRFCIGK